MGTVLEKTSADELIMQLKLDLERNLHQKISRRPDRFLIEKVVSGGKRLRPLLLLAVFKALGGEGYQKALDVAVALELAHSASLVHDDIIDLDKKRRGNPSLWCQIGMLKAIIQGHRIINLAFEIALNIGVEIARIFVDTWERASKGVLTEVLNRAVFTDRIYMFMVKEKTASLFEAAAHAGALLAGADAETTELMKRYGSDVGTAYQLADDLAEIYMKKKRGAFMYVLQDIRDRFIHMMVAAGTGTSKGIFKAITPASPSEDFLKKQIVAKIKSAIKIAKSPQIPETPYKYLLQKIPIYFVKQMFGEARRYI